MCQDGEFLQILFGKNLKLIIFIFATVIVKVLIIRNQGVNIEASLENLYTVIV